MKTSLLFLAAVAAAVGAGSAGDKELISEKPAVPSPEKAKRKNVANLDALLNAIKEENPSKRKNIADLSDILSSEKPGKSKRKNIADLAALLESHQPGKSKRKNVVDLLDMLNAVSDADAEENAKSANSEKVTQKRGLAQQPLLSEPAELDVLQTVNLSPEISIFAAYLRDSELLADIALGQVPVVLAPSNDAVSSELSGKKPWEFPKKVNSDADADQNIAYFLRHHLAVSTSPLAASSLHATLLAGEQLVLENGKLSQNGNLITIKSVSHTNNAVILVIDDCLVKP